MKKYINMLFIICLVLIQNYIYAEESIKIKTESGGKEIIIPDNYGDLREAYIEICKLYIYAEEDLTKTLEDNKILLEKINILLDNSKILQNDIALVLKEKNKIDFYKNGLILGIGTELDFSQLLNDGIQFNPEIYLGYKLLFFEKFSIDLMIKYPIGFSIFAGLLF